MRLCYILYSQGTKGNLTKSKKKPNPDHVVLQDTN